MAVALALESKATWAKAAWWLVSEITCWVLQVPERSLVEEKTTVVPLDVPCHTMTPRALEPEPPTATEGNVAEELVIVVLEPQFPPKSFVEVSTLPLLTHAAMTSPAPSTPMAGEEAPDEDREVEALQLPPNGLAAALIMPPSSQTAVALPLESDAMRGRRHLCLKWLKLSSNSYSRLLWPL